MVACELGYMAAGYGREGRRMIIAFDPSGNFKEGKGTTGICLMWDKGEIQKVDQIHAGDYDCAEAYWRAHIHFLTAMRSQVDIEVVMEGFRLYGHKSKEQTNSEFETPMLIGLIRYYCYKHEIPLTIQFATEVKTRWSDKVLLSKEIIYNKGNSRYLVATDQSLNNHKTDAVRHAMHYFRYKRK
jgi:hypothetical protein